MPHTIPKTKSPPKALFNFIPATTKAYLILGLVSIVTVQAQRTYTPGHFILTMDGKSSILQNVEGGNAYADVIESKEDQDGYTQKQIGKPKYEDIKIELDIGSPSPIYSWVQGWDFKDKRKSGSIIMTDTKFRERAKREFYEALISEVSFPKLDAGSKESGFLTVTLAPEYMRTVAVDGGVKDGKNYDTLESWQSSDFYLEIDGLDCSKISKIESFTIKQSVKPTSVIDSVIKDTVVDQRDARFSQLEPTKIEIPNLVITMDEADAQSFLDYFEDFVIKGNNGDEKEKTGRIVYLNRNRQKVLLSLELAGIGIFKMSEDKSESSETSEAKNGNNKPRPRRVVFEMYLENIVAKFGG